MTAQNIILQYVTGSRDRIVLWKSHLQQVK